MLRNYLKMALKVLNRRWFYTFISLFGITFTLAILMVVTAFFDHLVGQHAPETKLDQSLVVVRMRLEGKGDWTRTSANSTYFLEKYVRGLETPEQMTFYSFPSPVTTFAEGQNVSLDRKYTDADFWQVFSFNFIEGRPYREEEVSQRARVAVISEALKKKLFGTQSAINQSIKIDQQNYTVIGVVASTPITRIHSYGELYMPYTLHKGYGKGKDLEGSFLATLVAPSEEAVEAMLAEYDQMASQIENPDPDNIGAIYSNADSYLGGFTRTLGVGNSQEDSGEQVLYTTLFVLGLFFILLPTVNLMNINISRILERASEIGVRKAFGASSRILILQFVIENMVLTLVGGLLAFGVAWLSLYLINEAQLIAAMELQLSLKVFIYGLLFTLLFGLLSGVYPAWRMSRLQVADALKTT